MAASVKSKGNEGRTAAPTSIRNNPGATECVICAKLGRTLDRCKAARNPYPLCTELDQLLTREVNERVDDFLTNQFGQTDRIKAQEMETQLKAAQETSQKVAEKKRKQISSLNEKYEQEEEREKELQKVLDKRIRTHKARQEQLSEWEGLPQVCSIKPAKVKKGMKGMKG